MPRFITICQSLNIFPCIIFSIAYWDRRIAINLLQCVQQSELFRLSLKLFQLVFRMDKRIWFLAGFCLSGNALYYWSNVQWNVRYAITDFGMIALALLANDRYRSIEDPVKYLASDVSPFRRALSVAILVTFANGLEIVVQCNFIRTNIYHVFIAAAIFPLSQAIRTIYLLICFFV